MDADGAETECLCGGCCCQAESARAVCVDRVGCAWRLADGTSLMVLSATEESAGLPWSLNAFLSIGGRPGVALCGEESGIERERSTVQSCYELEVQMIARMWHGAAPIAKGEEYLQRMRNVALPDYRSISGNRGAFCLYRVEGDVAHFEMLTFWDDVEAIKRFAGEDFQRAKYYEFDRSFLIELEPNVRHYTAYDD